MTYHLLNFHTNENQLFVTYKIQWTINDESKLQTTLCLWGSICVWHPFNRKPEQKHTKLFLTLNSETVYTENIHIILYFSFYAYKKLYSFIPYRYNTFIIITVAAGHQYQYSNNHGCLFALHNTFHNIELNHFHPHGVDKWVVNFISWCYNCSFSRGALWRTMR